MPAYFELMLSSRVHPSLALTLVPVFVRPEWGLAGFVCVRQRPEGIFGGWYCIRSGGCKTTFDARCDADTADIDILLFSRAGSLFCRFGLLPIGRRIAFKPFAFEVWATMSSEKYPRNYIVPVLCAVAVRLGIGQQSFLRRRVCVVRDKAYCNFPTDVLLLVFNHVGVRSASQRLGACWCSAWMGKVRKGE